MKRLSLLKDVRTFVTGNASDQPYIPADYGALEAWVLANISNIVNQPGMNWKQRRATLRFRYPELSEELVVRLCPEDDPGDY